MPLVGNFFFGFLLGGATGLGCCSACRSTSAIAFSSAYLGYASAALDFSIPLTTAAIAFAGVLLIGLTNLTVSFALTLSVAMRARRITFAQSRSLGGLLLRRLLRAPCLPVPAARGPSVDQLAWSDAAERLECASPSPRHSSMDRTGASKRQIQVRFLVTGPVHCDFGFVKRLVAACSASARFGRRSHAGHPTGTSPMPRGYSQVLFDLDGT